ncbi:hypothetical protein ACQKTA_09065 [Enterococcus sp. 22-H-5-01]|uniref:hypothetical protein n=1 Tax=Enterococcus sp. 22-H-5-01 TaxID=3418555 RepID=UPI003D03CAD3
MARNKRRSNVPVHEDIEERHYAEKANSDSLSTLQQLTLIQEEPLEYWRLYKEQILESEKEFNYKGHHFVGGIDIHDENFEYLVIEQLENK